MRKLAGILALVMVLTMAAVPAFAEGEVAQTPGIGMEDNYTVIDDDFSDPAVSANWTLTGPANIKDGVLNMNQLDSTEASTVVWDLTNYSFDGTWYVTFKAGVIPKPGATSSDYPLNYQFGFGGAAGRVYGNFRGDGVFSITTTTPNALDATYRGFGAKEGFTDGDMYEYLFELNGDDDFIFYRRHYSTDVWTQMMKTKAAWHTGSSKGISLTAAAGCSVILDDFKVFYGSYAKIDEPAVGDGEVRANGSFLYGAPDTEGSRSFTQLTAVYDKKYGYTKKVFAENRTAYPTETMGLANTYGVSGVNAENATAAGMLWDSVETGIPLVAAKDSLNRNVADNIFESDPIVGLATSVNFNEVTVGGYLGMGQTLTASLAEKATGNLAAVAQTTTNGVGKAKLVLGVDPAVWASGTYILRTQTGSAVVESQEVEIFTNDILGSGVTTVDEMENFLANYAAEEIKAQASDEGFAESVFAQYQELAGENAGAVDLYAFREYLDPAIGATIAERELLADFNREINQKVVVWGNVRNLITDTYAETLGLTEEDLGKINSVNDQKTLFTSFRGEYTAKADVLADLRAKVDAMLASQSIIGGGTSVVGPVGGGVTGGGAGGGGGFGGGGNYLSGEKKGDTTEEPIGQPPKQTEGTEEGIQSGFHDLGTVPWAKDSILALQNLGVISGDGSGKFEPGRAVTREEFLKMAMQAAGIDPVDSPVPFTDVEPGAWYYPYVATAYEKGIVTGIDEDTFGIGQKITRADMAVMLKRIIEYVGIDLIPTQNAFVFDDYKTIPKYARESITVLCQVGLMQGVGDNRFDAPASATRAEAAVAIYRVYNYITKGR